MMKRLVTLFFLLALPLSAGAEVVDGVVAVVGEKIITLSEVLREAKIVRVLESKERSVTLPLEVDFSREILDQMINRDLVYGEARKAGPRLQDVHILDEMLQFEGKFQKPLLFYVFLEEEGLNVEMLAERLRMERISRDYVVKRLSLMAAVSRKEVEDFYLNSGAYEGSELAAVEGEIRDKLMKEKMGRSLDEWLINLRKRGRVSYLMRP